MKEFLGGLWALIWAIIVSVLVFAITPLYSLGYSIFMSVKYASPVPFFKFWVRLVDGIMASLGYMFYEIGYTLDMMWNVNGELLEDMITHKEDTTFSDKNISVSASVGKLETEGDLNKYGLFCSKVLSFAFNQKQHALDTWAYTKAKKELKGRYFEKK